MKAFSFFLFVLILPLAANTQNYFSLNRLIEFSNYDRLSGFDQRVRGYSYLLDEVIEYDGYTIYEYAKRYETANRIYINYISYCDYGDGRPVVKFVSSIPGFYNNIRKQISASGFQEIDFKNDGNTLIFDFENPSYRLQLHTIPRPKTESNKAYNMIKIRVWKKFL